MLKEEFVIQPTKGWLRIDFKELYRYRELLYFLTLRDILVRYKQTVLGAVWAILQPFFMMLIFTMVFGRFAKMDSEGYPYSIYVYGGLLAWTFFSTTVNQAANSLVSQQALLTKIYFPRLFVPFSCVGAACVDFCLAFLVYFGLMAYHQTMPQWTIIFIPCLLVILFLFTLGLGYFLAALTVSYRDFKYVVPFMMQSLMFLSPVVYPVGIVPEKYQWILALNPMVGIIESFRAAILGSNFDLLHLMMSIVISIAMFFFGIFYFRSVERRFADLA